MSELLEDMCMVVAVGPQLQVVTMNDGLKNLLRIDQVPGAKMPEYVHDMIPDAVHELHKKWVTRSFSEGCLPDSLMHPLRSIKVKRAGEPFSYLCAPPPLSSLALLPIVAPDLLGRPLPKLPSIQKPLLSMQLSAAFCLVVCTRGGNLRILFSDGTSVKCDISIGTMTEGVEMASSPFYAILTPIPGEDDDQHENWRRAAAYIYGANVAKAVARGDVPSPEIYQSATILYLDVVNFTTSCASRSPTEVAQWMGKFHQIVESEICNFSVRKIETRGDCYCCVTGTNAVDGDLASNQMTRMVGFAQEVCTRLLDESGTNIRIGIAYGPVTIAYIGTNQFVPTMCAFGQTINTAASMESSGKSGLVHLTEGAAQQYAEEYVHLNHTKVDYTSSLHDVETKTQGYQTAAWYDVFKGEFRSVDQ